MKKYPLEMKRLSKRMLLTKENIEKIPEKAHGIYLIRDKNDKVLYVGLI